MKRIGYLLVLGAIGLFGTIEVVTKYLQAYGHAETPVGALQLAALRFFLGGLFLLPMAFTRRRVVWIAVRTRPLSVLVLGAVGVFLTFYLFHQGLASATASSAAVVFSMNPIFTAALAAAVLQERLKAGGWLGIVLGLAGALAAVTGFRFEGLFSRAEFLGNVQVLAAALCWSVYTVSGKKHAEDFGGLSVSFLSIVVGSVFFALILSLQGGWKEMATYSARSWLWISYLGLVTVGLGYILYFEGMSRVPASRGASLFYVKPVLAVFLAHLFLGEKIGWPLLLAAVLVALGIILVALPDPAVGTRKRRTKASPGGCYNCSSRGVGQAENSGNRP